MKLTVAEIEKMIMFANRKMPCPKFALEHSSPKWTMGKPTFTGWKGSVPGAVGVECTMDSAAVVEVEKAEVSFCAQWIVAFGKDLNSPDCEFFYVNVPSPTGGRYERGSAFDVGTERVTLDTPPERLEELCKAGYERLCETVKEYGHSLG